MCVLSNQDIVRRVKEGSLVIEPFDLESVGPESVDLHLLGEYTFFEGTWILEAVDLSTQVRRFLGGKIGQCKKHVSSRPDLVLRPGYVVVARLKERIEMPDDLCAIIDGKSKWAQLGLQVASAGLVHAGWEGWPVLELVNLGNIPLKLSPGLPICQISFHTLTSPALSSEELQVLWKGGGNV